MARRIYVLMTCDEWKSKSSMRFYAACTSPTKLRTLISRGIEKDFFSYNDESRSFKEQAKNFRSDWAKTVNDAYPNYPMDELLGLCGRVKYVHITVAEDGVVEV